MIQTAYATSTRSDVTSDLDEQQARILVPSTCLVLACPGAGKTRSLVARYIVGRTTPWQGKALLSFTNRAVLEARSRCRAQPELLSTPNFVGTFDSFIHRYIVTPWYVSRYGTVPNYFASYREVRIADTTVRTVPGYGVNLSNFRMVEGQQTQLVESSLERQESQYVQMRGISVPQLEAIAYRRIRSLIIDDGIVDCQSARFVAASVLDLPQGETVLDRLRLRFEEVIVDEAQDCDDYETRVLQLLRDRGLPVVAVADPDQSIYGFRGAGQVAFRSYAESFSTEETVRLDRNYRSTSAICQLISTMRSDGVAVSSARTHERDPGHVYVLEGDESEKSRKFADLTRSLNIPSSESIVLAHTWSAARRLSGREHQGRTRRFMEVFLRHLKVAEDRARPLEERTRAVREMEMMILEIFDWRAATRRSTREAMLGVLDRDEEWLRSIRAGLVCVIRQNFELTSVAGAAREFIRRELDCLDVPLRRIGSLVQQPSFAEWNNFAAEPDEQGVLECSSIHSAKGGEWEAVLLEVAPDQRFVKGLVDWLECTYSEELRVLYVGASRAKRLLALSQTRSSEARIQDILRAKDLPFRVM